MPSSLWRPGMKKAICILIGCALFAFCSFCFADTATLSLPEVRATTPDVWDEIYETPWRTITVHARIEVPDADRFPVLVVCRTAGFLSDAEQKQYTQYSVQKDGSIDRVRKGTEVVFKAGQWLCDIDEVSTDRWNQVLPDNSDVSFREATESILSEAERICGINSDSLLLSKVRLRSRYYKKADYSPQTEYGTWMLTWKELFHGISYDRASDCYGELGIENIPNVYAELSGYYTAPEDYVITFSLLKEVREETEDLPLYSWEKARAAFEKEISAGHLRSVDEVKLCYIPYEDPTDPSLYWLLPAWICRGMYIEDPTEDPTVWTDEATGETYFVENTKSVVFQANLGEVIDYNNNNKNRRKYPGIIRWADMK